MSSATTPEKELRAFIPGTLLPGFRHTVTGMIMRTRQWHGSNIVHSDPAMAARQGLQNPPATGQISASYIQRMCVSYFGRAIFEGSVFDVRFRAPVFEGDTLTVGGEVLEVIRRPEMSRVVIEAWCRNDQGVDVTRARVEVNVPAAAPL